MAVNHAKRREYWTQYQREWRKRNPDKLRSYSKKHRLRHPEVCKRADWNCKLKKAYGISISEYEERLQKQNGVCMICGEPPSKTAPQTQRLHVDHDHETKDIRGLLCLNCNRGLGAFRDKAELLKKALLYLETKPWQ